MGERRRFESREQVIDKTREVLSKFSKEIGSEKYYTDPLIRKSVDSIVYGNDPYTVIERLWDIIDSQQQLVCKLSQTAVPLIDKVRATSNEEYNDFVHKNIG